MESFNKSDTELFSLLFLLSSDFQQYASNYSQSICYIRFRHIRFAKYINLSFFISSNQINAQSCFIISNNLFISAEFDTTDRFSAATRQFVSPQSVHPNNIPLASWCVVPLTLKPIIFSCLISLKLFGASQWIYQQIWAHFSSRWENLTKNCKKAATSLVASSSDFQNSKRKERYTKKNLCKKIKKSANRKLSDFLQLNLIVPLVIAFRVNIPNPKRVMSHSHQFHFFELFFFLSALIISLSLVRIHFDEIFVCGNGWQEIPQHISKSITWRMIL